MEHEVHELHNVTQPLLADENLNIFGESMQQPSINPDSDVTVKNSHTRSSFNLIDVNSDHNVIFRKPADESVCFENDKDLSKTFSDFENIKESWRPSEENLSTFAKSGLGLAKPKQGDKKRKKISLELTKNEVSKTSVEVKSETPSPQGLPSPIYNEQRHSFLIFGKSSPSELPTDNMLNGNPQGWDTVRKKLPNIAALQKVPLQPRRQSKRFLAEQESFLERFSTREYKQEHKTPAYGQRRVSRPNVLLGLGKHQPFGTERLEKINNSSSRESAVNLMPIAEDNSEERSLEVRKRFYLPWKVYSWLDSHFMSIIEPHCNVMYYWQYLLLMAIHYNAWVVIMRISYKTSQSQFVSTWFALDYIGDFIYISDIFICIRISFLENGMYVTDLRRVALRYTASLNFILDALTLLPLDLLYLKFGPNPILRLPRLIKFYKVFQCRKMIESLTSIPNVIRALFLLHLMFLLIHWNGCFYFMMSRAEGFGSNSWVYPQLVGPRSRLLTQYIHCFYWSTLSLTTIGEGRGGPITLAENIYMIVCYITGIFIFATMVGQAGSVIQNMNASRMEFEKQRDNTMQYMKTHNVPKDLQRRVRLWYDYSYSRGRFQGGNDINEMTLLPNKMKTELALHVHLETLRKVSFLQKVQPDFLHDLVLKMKLHIFTPGDYICRKGEIAREMYVISDGILEVVSETGKVLKVLHPGNFFGEIGILSLSEGQNRRTADVRCCGYVELFVLYKDDVLAAIQDYPDTQKILSRYGRKRLNRGNHGSNLSDGSTSDSEEETMDENKEKVDKMVERVELGTQELNSTTSQLSITDSLIPKPLAPRRISVEPIREETGTNVETYSAPSSALSTPAKSLGPRLPSTNSLIINMTPHGSPLQGSKSSIHNALISTVTSVVGPASPTIIQGTTATLRRKRFSESRSSSSPLLRKKRLSLSGIGRHGLDEDITTGLFRTESKLLVDRLEDRRLFKKSLNEAHLDALQTLESSFYRKINKEQLKLKERIKELENIIDIKTEEIFFLQQKVRDNEDINGKESINSEQKSRAQTPAEERKSEECC